MKEITLANYLQNSGTRGIKPLDVYDEHKVSYRRFRYEVGQDGILRKIEILPNQYPFTNSI